MAISKLSAIFPPAPTFTDKHLPSLAGKVYIVTGAASGVGYQLAKILYKAGGTVYIAARSASRCSGAIIKLQNEVTEKSAGNLESMIIDLSDLRTVKPAVEAFLAKETRLDVLVHNAAVMTPPAGSKDKLGHDLEIGTNDLAPYLLTLLLEPILIKTATTEGLSQGSVRIVWVTSMLVGGPIPENGMKFDKDGIPVYLPKFMENYFQSKIGVAWLADKFAKRLGDKGVLSISLHPGLMLTELQRNSPAMMRWTMGLMFKPPVYGAYSELYAGFSPAVRMEHNGGHTIAWGRNADLPGDVLKGLKSTKEGGSGVAQIFFDYCDREIKEYL
ncbi:putative oxidoreductase [Lachnellula suecica]|uniref:Putative oxidoreductase n=1 Tax=Lachnellula suecica TaxID=602035 RepID=A0A8T9CA50_9HELO|nr:putative oxidoreductase [Lachnellula suecica]